jgi:hypothetical protein
MAMMAITTRSSINVNPLRFRTMWSSSFCALMLSVCQDAQAFRTLLIAHDVFHGIECDEVCFFDAVELFMAKSTFAGAAERRHRLCGWITAFRPTADRGEDYQRHHERRPNQTSPPAPHPIHAVRLVAKGVYQPSLMGKGCAEPNTRENPGSHDGSQWPLGGIFARCGEFLAATSKGKPGLARSREGAHPQCEPGALLADASCQHFFSRKERTDLQSSIMRRGSRGGSGDGEFSVVLSPFFAPQKKQKTRKNGGS